MKPLLVNLTELEIKFKSIYFIRMSLDITSKASIRSSYSISVLMLFFEFLQINKELRISKQKSIIAFKNTFSVIITMLVFVF